MRKLLFFALFSMILVGCKTKQVVVTVPEYHTDTIWKSNTLRDSIYLHDSVYVREQGDTILIERWHTAYRDRVKTDTIYKSRVDSVGVPYPVTEYVEKELTKAQKGLMGMGVLSLIGIVAFAGFKIKKLFP